MLYSLKIENIAIIEQAEIDFSAGLNTLTGETGAGKSIIIDALNAALGERTSRDMVRSGAHSAKVTAVFENAAAVNGVLEDAGIDIDPNGTLIITRTISEDGRSACRINGCPANVSMLKNISSLLINIHGQHDNQALLSPEKHYMYLDGAADNSQLLADYRKTYYETVAVKKELDSLATDESEKAAKLDYLNFQISEIEQADVRVGERDELNAAKLLISNSKKVLDSLGAAYAALSGTDDIDGAASIAASCAQSLSGITAFFPEITDCAKAVREAEYTLEDCASQIRGFIDSFDFRADKLAQINERLDTLYRLSMKYGLTEQEILDYLDKAKSQRSSFELSDKRIEELENKLGELSVEISRKAQLLTQSRRKAADVFESNVRRELDFLDMPGVSFKVDISRTPMTSRGADNVEFLISANPGQEPRPLAKIASGGELSRIMLAIKSVISAKDDIDTLIFDEIDTGVSGRAAQKIAMKLRDVSRGRQVICVTHLAQIAARAQRHMLISKCVEGGKTYTRVDDLTYEDRIKELARITGGIEITQLQLQSAREMLEAAQNEKESYI